MDKDRIANIVSMIKSKKEATEKEENTPSHEEKIAKISKIMLDIDNAISELDD